MAALPQEIWKSTGLTEHLGGFHATQRLISQMGLPKNSSVVDLGCGTGYTSTILADYEPEKIIALDLIFENCLRAKNRLADWSITKLALIAEGNALTLPLPKASRDAVVIESVLVFTDAMAVLKGVKRILKPGAVVGINEMTFLGNNPSGLEIILRNSFNIRAYNQKTWGDIFKRAGFQVLFSAEYPINIYEQLSSHMAVDGIVNYLKALISSLGKFHLWKAALQPDLLKAYIRYRKSIGYGLYILKNPKP